MSQNYNKHAADNLYQMTADSSHIGLHFLQNFGQTTGQEP